MSELTVPCPACTRHLDEEYVNSGRMKPCRGCGVPVLVEVYPSLYHSHAWSRAIESVEPIPPGVAACFTHADRPAVAACEDCGRFLCRLCEIEISGRRLCPTCIEKGRRSGKVPELVREHTLHDGLALWLVLLPFAFFPMAPFSAPYSLFLCFHHWNQAGGLFPRGNTRLWIALILSMFWIILTLAVLGLVTVALLWETLES